MDNIINFEINSNLHSIASKAIITHLTEKEIIKENEKKISTQKKSSGNSFKEYINTKNDKKNINTISKSRISALGLKK